MKKNEDIKGEPFFPHHVLKQLIIILLIFGLLIALATYIPAPMEIKADPYSTPEHIKPEWYFLISYQLLKLAEKLDFLGPWAPKVIGVLGQGIIIAIIFFLPFIDRGSERYPHKRPIAIILGILGVISFIILTIWGHYS
ncbi:MAG: hypothetical protein HY999_04910 [Nitrospinae bacterium]|nr:hypothetical protein [Nitrospinota bacterium]